MTELEAVDPAKLVSEYIQLRNDKNEFNKKFKDLVAVQYDAPMEEIEQKLLNLFAKTGLEQIASAEGTAFRKISTSVTIADQSTFRRHVIGVEGWDLIDWRANKTAINELVEQGEPVPPGVNRSAIYTVGIRTKS